MLKFKIHLIDIYHYVWISIINKEIKNCKQIYWLSSLILFLAPDAGASNDKSSWVGQALTKSDRPELTSADTVISGGKQVVVYT